MSEAVNFLLTDSNVDTLAPALIERVRAQYSAKTIVVPAGEQSKSLDTLASVWKQLSEGGATRRSTLICVGGGMVTDLGGFAAACFKRGIPHTNVATTLLAAVDASLGGKTGIDFLGLKNELGAFKMPLESIADIPSFRTLPPMEILSGWAEAVKTAYIADAKMTDRMLAVDPLEISDALMTEFVDFCRATKLQVVDQDPTEKGLRKILNFGHTAGHAMETLLLQRGAPVAHGVAVAHGILIALILSHDLLSLPSAEVTRYAAWLRQYYPRLTLTCRDFDAICATAAHDKKNLQKGILNFVLLEAPGRPRYDIPVTTDQLLAALDLYASMM